ncbi:MAG TPA: tetratricopeptide repeat protein [candidate division Zixibacteria bacterium]
MRKKTVLIGLFILFLPLYKAIADTESATALFNKGNQYYDDGKFDQAIEEYEKIINLGIKNYQVYYNLGNAYFRQNQLGNAILSYRRALVLKPCDEDTEANLAFVKLFTLDKLEEQKINPLSNLLVWFLGLWSKDNLAILTSLFYVLSIAAGIFILFWGAKRYLLFGLICFLILFAISGTSLWAKINSDSIEYGVVVASQAEVRSGPGSDYVLQFTGHEGLEFRVEEQAEGWYRISLPNGIKGWIPKEAVEIV